ncbi:MAG: hypothetical protein H8E16_17315 [Flavobacteriales bacterium]|nr:hypothetical protein [Flavobacteriales bacterium]
MKVKIGKYEYEKSSKKDKKLQTTVNKKIIHFGGNPETAKHFNDKTGLLKKSLNHNDPKIKKAWYARHGKVTNKEGKLVINDATSPSYHSAKILW